MAGLRVRDVLFRARLDEIISRGEQSDEAGVNADRSGEIHLILSRDEHPSIIFAPNSPLPKKSISSLKIEIDIG